MVNIFAIEGDYLPLFYRNEVRWETRKALNKASGGFKRGIKEDQGDVARLPQHALCVTMHTLL